MTKQLVRKLTPNIMYNLLYSELKVDEEYFKDTTEDNYSLIPVGHRTQERTFHFHTRTKNGFTCTIYIITPYALTLPTYYLFSETDITARERQILHKQLAFGHLDNLPQTVGDFKLLDKHPTLIAYYCITPYLNLTLEDLQIIFDSKLSAMAEKEVAATLHTRRTENIMNSLTPINITTLTEDSAFTVTTTVNTQWSPRLIESASRIDWASLNQALSLSNNENT